MASTPRIQDIVLESSIGGVQPLRLLTARGEVRCRYWPVENPRAAVVLVPGAIDAWHSPGGDLYGRLTEAFAHEHIASLRVRYRSSHVLTSAVWDVLTGLDFLQLEGVGSLGAVGHSFGGAVVIEAAVEAPAVHAIAALAPQSFGAERVGSLAGRCGVLVVHGQQDEVLPVRTSQTVFDLAGEPKKLILYDDAHHGLEEVADGLFHEVHDWIVAHLLQPV